MIDHVTSKVSTSLGKSPYPCMELHWVMGVLSMWNMSDIKYYQCETVDRNVHITKICLLSY